MATPTYTLLDSVTLASSAASVTFSSIDQSYGDLVLVMDATSTGTTSVTRARVNSDTGTNYTSVFMRGNSIGVQSSTVSADHFRLGSAVTLSGVEGYITRINFLDYSATDKHKAMLLRLDNASYAGGATEASAVRWADTSAINTIEIYVTTNAIDAGSTFHLYGIAKAL